jgi:hypothetical protein
MKQFQGHHVIVKYYDPRLPHTIPQLSGSYNPVFTVKI